MQTENAVQELLDEAQRLRIKLEVIDLAEILMMKNPEMDEETALKQAFNHLKLYV